MVMVSQSVSLGVFASTLVLGGFILSLPVTGSCQTPGTQALCILPDPIEFLGAIALFAVATSFLFLTGRFGNAGIVVFSLVFFGFFLLKLPYPRSDELGTVLAVQEIVQHGVIPAPTSPLAYESPSMPFLFLFSSEFAILTGASPFFTAEVLRVGLPVVLAGVVLAIVRRSLGGVSPLVTALIVIGTYGFSDVFQFTPAYLNIVAIFTLILVLFTRDDGNRHYILLTLTAVFVIFAHVFGQIYLLCVTVPVILLSRKGASRKRGVLFVIALLPISLAYDFYFVAQFGGFLLSGLDQATAFIGRFFLSSTDLASIQAHVSGEPVWSLLTVYLWATVTAIGALGSIVCFVKYQERRWLPVLLGLGTAMLFIEVVQSAQSGLPLDILTFFVPFAIISLAKLATVYTTSKPRLRVVLRAFAGLMLVLMIVPSMLTYNSLVFTQSSTQTDIASLEYNFSFGSSLTSVYSAYPAGSFAPNAAIVQVAGSASSIASGISSFLSSTNAVLYLNLQRVSLSNEFFLGLDSTQSHLLYSPLVSADLVFSTGQAFEYFLA